MQRITASSLFLVLLIGASLLALARSAGVVSHAAIDAGSPRSVATARAYYVAVQDFFETGDLSEVQGLTAPELFDGSPSDDRFGDLAFHLRGLRETYPALTFAIEEMTASGATVITRLAVSVGQVSTVPVVPLISVQRWQQIETLRISNNRIAEWRSIGPLFGYFVSIPGSGQTFPIHADRTLTAARMSFTGDQSGFVALDAPALVVPERGALLLQGNGVATMFGPDSSEGRVTTPGIDVIVEPGETIVVPRGLAVLSAGASMPSSALVVQLAPTRIDPVARETHRPYPSPEELLGAGSAGQIGPGISIAPLDSAAIPTHGELELVMGVVHIEPLSGMGLVRDVDSVLVLPRLGQISMRWDTSVWRRMLVNEGRATATAWVIGVRPAPAE